MYQDADELILLNNLALGGVDDGPAKFKRLAKERAFARGAMSSAHSAGIFQPGVNASGSAGGAPHGIVLSPLSASTGPLFKATPEQMLALNILDSHVHRTVEGKNPEQLLMYIRGASRSGKTALLMEMKKIFEVRGCTDIAAITAGTMAAAGLLNSNLLQWWAGFPMGHTNRYLTFAVAANPARDSRVSRATYLLIDQVSVLTNASLTHLHACVAAVRERASQGNRALPFAGLHVLLFGDMHQLPAFFAPPDRFYSGASIASSGLAFDEFTTIVTLRSPVENARDDFLLRLRTGRCTAADAAMLRSRVITDKTCALPDFDAVPWMDAPLVATRLEVISQWNAASVAKQRRRSGQVHYVCHAVDTIRGHLPTTEERTLIAQVDTRSAARLPHEIEIAVGVKVWATIGTARLLAVITDITLHAKEDTQSLDLLLPLNHLPVSVTCAVPDGRTLTLVPTVASFQVQDADGNTLLVHREQLPVKLAYAMTQYEADGLSFQNVFLDVAVSTGQPKYPEVYSALSKGRDWDAILLLRDIGVDIRALSPPLDLLAHDTIMDLASLTP